MDKYLKNIFTVFDRSGIYRLPILLLLLILGLLDCPKIDLTMVS